MHMRVRRQNTPIKALVPQLARAGNLRADQWTRVLLDPEGWGKGCGKDEAPEADVGGFGGLGTEAELDAEPLSAMESSACAGGAIANSTSGAATKRRNTGSSVERAREDRRMAPLCARRGPSAGACNFSHIAGGRSESWIDPEDPSRAARDQSARRGSWSSTHQRTLSATPRCGRSRSAIGSSFERSTSRKSSSSDGIPGDLDDSSLMTELLTEQATPRKS